MERRKAGKLLWISMYLQLKFFGLHRNFTELHCSLKKLRRSLMRLRCSFRNTSRPAEEVDR